ncbi:MAG: hypothetical protein V9G19_14570 [Tetrasphaera sp.]
MSPDERWARLFADLEMAFEAEERRRRDSEVADRTRRERAGVTLAARLTAHRGQPLQARLLGGLRVEGQLIDVGRDWCAITAGASRALVVPLPAIASVTGLTHRGDFAPRRFALGYALRGISRDRAPALVTDVLGTGFQGTIDVVGKDFLDLAEHPIDEARRSRNVRNVRTIPFACITSIQTG